MLEKRKIIIDCDPGVDDAYAIMLANSHEGFDIRGITPVAGNVAFTYTHRNALDLTEMLGMDVPVAMGAEKPLILQLETADLVHGKNGLADYVFEKSTRNLAPIKAWDLMYQEAVKLQGELEIIAVGPLTNVAIAILKYPDLKRYVKSLTIMGGSATTGNHSPYGEFNIWVDPHAAEIVFQSGIPITMIGLNTTRQAAFTREEMEEFGKEKSLVQPLLKAMTEYSFEKGWSRKTGSMILHDAITVGHLMDEELIQTEKYYVAVEYKGVHTMGQTVVDFSGVCKKEPNVEVAMKVDKERFRKMLQKMVKFYQV